MISTVMKHAIYEKCIDVFFHHVTDNFIKPLLPVEDKSIFKYFQQWYDATQASIRGRNQTVIYVDDIQDSEFFMKYHFLL